MFLNRFADLDEFLRSRDESVEMDVDGLGPGGMAENVEDGSDLVDLFEGIVRRHVGDKSKVVNGGI